MPASSGARIGISGVSISVVVERQVAGDLVADQQRHLAHQPAELGDRRLLHPHQGQLVLDQRMVDDDEIGHAEATVVLEAAKQA